MTIGPRQPRRERNSAAAAQIGNLRIRRTSVEGQAAQSSSPAPSTTPKIITPRKPLVRKELGGARGTMIRAPSALKVTRNAAGPQAGRPSGGPNLRARAGGPSRSRGGPKKAGSEADPKKRERSSAGSGAGVPTLDPDTVTPQALDSSLMQTLYRMQRNQWDRKPYEPKYAQGSFAANELIHAGRELFRGEAPPVKVWGRLERTLNIVGMHGAASHLKVRRVLDGDDMPFGKEHENLLDLQKSAKSEQKPQEIAA